MRNNLDALYGGAKIDALITSTYSRGEEKKAERGTTEEENRKEE
jgi:hypothetical protein